MDPSHVAEVDISAGIITVSTSRTLETDDSGKAISTLFGDAGIKVVFYEVIPDEIQCIRSTLLRALETSNCIVLNGGTGLTSDDCTIEAIVPLLGKQMDGFGELFRLLSFEEIGTRALLSRAVAGIIDGRAVFSLPGSEAAVRLATGRLIIPEIRHILTHALK